MSRLARKAIIIPDNISASFDNSTLIINGNNHQKSIKINSFVDVRVANNSILVVPGNSLNDSNKFVKQNLGTIFRLISSAISDIVSSSNLSAGFSLRVKTDCVGSRSFVSNGYLVIFLGYSHFSSLKIPQGISVVSEQKDIIIKGFKEEVSSFADKIRYLRRWDPCARRGVYFEHEKIRVKKCKKS